ncbi:MAG: MGMT family protein [Oscillospiraceae bacterium]|nr:MGMT family protein [Oscillospiraceae bacterium]
MAKQRRALKKRIPYGKVASYGQIAWILDEPHGVSVEWQSLRGLG